ncbi:MAG TPA: hypothetical protein PKY82_07115 [Pyrinomonadaceae bacterium]|nr:hypothetical protein [Pyrinomonadaceae bacterium]
MKKIFTLLIFSFGLLIGTVHAQQTEKPSVARTAFWTDGNTEVYLIEKGSGINNFGLMVISNRKNLKVFYRTSINSSKDVLKELIPVKTVNDRKYYEFGHHFSRTTIWMAIEFKLNNKLIDALTKTFYDGIFEVVPNEKFPAK